MQLASFRRYVTPKTIYGGMAGVTLRVVRAVKLENYRIINAL